MAEQKQEERARKILVVGGYGTVGAAVVKGLKEFAKKYNKKVEILIGGRNKDKSDVIIDTSSSESITSAFENEKCKGLTDVICCAGKDLMGPLNDEVVTRKVMIDCYNSRVFGQFDLVMKAQKYLSNDDDSVTLISGLAAINPFKLMWGTSTQDAAINAFVRASPIEIKKIRVNAVCAGMLTEVEDKYGAYFAGFKGVDGSFVANGFIRSIFGGIRGQVLYIDNPFNVRSI